MAAGAILRVNRGPGRIGSFWNVGSVSQITAGRRTSTAIQRTQSTPAASAAIGSKRRSSAVMAGEFAAVSVFPRRRDRRSETSRAPIRDERLPIWS
jgi:hypothetical protein